MCGRFALTEIPVALGNAFGLPWPATPPRANIAPTQAVLCLLRDPERGTPLVLPLQWGLVPGWSKTKVMRSVLFNARAETAHEKPSFRGAIRHRRCLIPATCFYEWSKEGNRKIPHAVSLTGGETMALAGLWELWEGPGEEMLYTCAVLTTDANDAMRAIHPRMPVILAPEAWEMWLDRHVQSHQEIQHLFAPAPSRAIQIQRIDSL